MRSSTELIGRGVGVGDTVGAVDLAVGLALTATAEGDSAGGVVAPPQAARTIASTTKYGRTVSVYRIPREISASASAGVFAERAVRTSGWETARS
jgi:hypothetical protein